MVSAQPLRLIYCADTSFLVNVQRTYPLGVFPGVWTRLSDLAGQGRLVAPREVLRELLVGDDEIAGWAKDRREMFRELDRTQATLARGIVSDPRFKGLFDPDKEIPDADPFVIALAVANQRHRSMFDEWLVVSDEARVTTARPTIPRVCRDPAYQVRCFRTLDVFRQEGWQF